VKKYKPIKFRRKSAKRRLSVTSQARGAKALLASSVGRDPKWNVEKILKESFKVWEKHRCFDRKFLLNNYSPLYAAIFGVCSPLRHLAELQGKIPTEYWYWVASQIGLEPVEELYVASCGRYAYSSWRHFSTKVIFREKKKKRKRS